MKILQVIDRLGVGGAERVLVDVSSKLKEKHDDVEVLCLLGSSELDEELKENKVNVIYLNRSFKYNPVTIIKLFSILNKYDIVHVHLRHVLRYVCLTKLYPFRRRNFKIVFHDHFGNISNDTTLTLYTRHCIRSVSAYIGVSSTLVDWAEVNKLNHKIVLLQNFIRSKEKNIKLRTSSSLISVGNIRPQKNYGFLLDLIQTLSDENSIDVYGKINDEPYFKSLKEKSLELGISHRVNFIFDRSSVTDILGNYSIALHTASSETGPLALIEYLSKNIPFLAYETGEVANILKPYFPEYFIDHFEIDGWVNRIREIQKTPPDIKKMQAVFEKHFGTEEYYSKLKNIYAWVLNN